MMEEEEERKRLITLALDGDVCTHIDNVTRPLGSAGPQHGSDCPRRSRIAFWAEPRAVQRPCTRSFLPQATTWSSRGIRPGALSPSTWIRAWSGPRNAPAFLHSPLLPWVQQEHPRLLAAALTILKAYYAADCPPAGHYPLSGSFEPWSNLVRQALIWCGEADPCEGRKTLEAGQ